MKKSIGKFSTTVVVTIVLMAAHLASAQGIVTGSISGAVLDPQGAVVAGATVHATQVETNRVFTTESSNAGVVQLSSLPPGHYNVEIDMQGFSNYGASNVLVEVGKDTSLGAIRMKVGNTSETV